MNLTKEQILERAEKCFNRNWMENEYRYYGQMSINDIIDYHYNTENFMFYKECNSYDDEYQPKHLVASEGNLFVVKWY